MKTETSNMTDKKTTTKNKNTDKQQHSQITTSKTGSISRYTNL